MYQLPRTPPPPRPRTLFQSVPDFLFLLHVFKSGSSRSNPSKSLMLVRGLAYSCAWTGIRLQVWLEPLEPVEKSYACSWTGVQLCMDWHTSSGLARAARTRRKVLCLFVDWRTAVHGLAYGF